MLYKAGMLRLILMPVLARIALTHLLLVAALLFLTQCAGAGRFKPRSKSDRAAKVEKSGGEDTNEESKEVEPSSDEPLKEGEDKQEDEDKEEGEKEANRKSEDKADYRLVAVDQTPFYRWMRTGLRGNSKPSRFLDKGTKVELLKENEEEQFSRIRLPDRKKGWVPSRLVSEKADEGVVDDSEETGDEEEAPIPAALPANGDQIQPPPPAQLPGPEENLPPISSEELPNAIVPHLEITPPKHKPRRQEMAPKVEADEPAAKVSSESEPN